MRYWEPVKKYEYSRGIKPRTLVKAKHNFAYFVKWFDIKGFRDVVPQNMHKFLNGGLASFGKLEHRARLDRPPRLDHFTAFRTRDRNRIYVYHPYSWTDDNAGALMSWCAKRDVVYSICPKSLSFYFPDCTQMIILMSKDTHVLCPSLARFIQEFVPFSE